MVRRSHVQSCASRGTSPIEGFVIEYVGRTKTLCWPLESTTELTIGQSITVWTASEAACDRINRMPTTRAMSDVRVVRLLDWLIANFGARLTVRYRPSSENEFADVLSGGMNIASTTIRAKRSRKIKTKAMHFYTSRKPLQKKNVAVIDDPIRLEWFKQAHYGHWNA